MAIHAVAAVMLIDHGGTRSKGSAAAKARMLGRGSAWTHCITYAPPAVTFLQALQPQMPTATRFTADCGWGEGAQTSSGESAHRALGSAGKSFATKIQLALAASFV